MPVNFYRREPNNQAGDSILGAVQGFLQGRKLKQENADASLARAYQQAQIDELRRKTEGLNAPAPEGYVRDPYSGDLKEDLSAPLNIGNGNPGGLIPKTVTRGKVQYIVPAGAEYEMEQKRLEDAQKPLSAEGAVKYEGAKQSVEQAGTVRRLVNETNFPKMKAGVSKIRVASKLGLNQPGSVRGNLTDFVTGGVARALFKTNDEQKQFELAVNLIAENNVRAKSGAAVPEPEQVREEARQLLADDSFKSFVQRLVVSEKYNRGLMNSIRPGSSNRNGNLDFSSMTEDELLKLAAE